MIRVLGTVLGHAKLLTCAGLVAGSCVAAPVAVHAYQHHHDGQTAGRFEDQGRGERGHRAADVGRHGRFEQAAYRHGPREGRW